MFLAAYMACAYAFGCLPAVDYKHKFDSRAECLEHATDRAAEMMLRLRDQYADAIVSASCVPDKSGDPA